MLTLQRDGAFWEDVERGAVPAALARPATRALVADRAFRARLAEIGAVTPEAARDASALPDRARHRARGPRSAPPGRAQRSRADGAARGSGGARQPPEREHARAARPISASGPSSRARRDSLLPPKRRKRCSSSSSACGGCPGSRATSSSATGARRTRRWCGATRTRSASSATCRCTPATTTSARVCARAAALPRPTTESPSSGGEDRAAFEAALATPAAQRAGAELLADEQRFIDLARSPLWLGEENAVVVR